MKRLLAMCIVLLAGCAQLVPKPDAEPAAQPLDAWQRVLERFVDDAGRVDYRALERDSADLKRFAAWVHATGIERQPLAYHLNAYNALALYNVLERGVPASLDGLEKLRFFVLREFDLGGRRLSLYAYENDVIRRFGDARIHFALNCMAASCPRLPRAPFRAEGLDAALEREARRFLNEPRNVHVNAATRTVRLSPYFKWYAEDFLTAAPTPIAYVNRYRSERIPEDYRVEFMPYDWTLNSQSR